MQNQSRVYQRKFCVNFRVEQVHIGKETIRQKQRPSDWRHILNVWRLFFLSKDERFVQYCHFLAIGHPLLQCSTSPLQHCLEIKHLVFCRCDKYWKQKELRPNKFKTVSSRCFRGRLRGWIIHWGIMIKKWLISPSGAGPNGNTIFKHSREVLPFGWRIWRQSHYGGQQHVIFSSFMLPLCLPLSLSCSLILAPFKYAKEAFPPVL